MDRGMHLQTPYSAHTVLYCRIRKYGGGRGEGGGIDYPKLRGDDDDGVVGGY